MMTVKDLRKKIEDLPDDAPVLLECSQVAYTFHSAKAIIIDVEPIPNSEERMTLADAGVRALHIF